MADEVDRVGKRAVANREVVVFDFPRINPGERTALGEMRRVGKKFMGLC